MAKPRKNSSKSVSELIRIGLVLNHDLRFYRDILLGVKEFAASRPHWILHAIPSNVASLHSSGARLCEGFIGHLFTRDVARRILRLGKPTVNVSGVLPDLGLPRVVVDHEEVGREAARHLLEMQLSHFGFVGFNKHDFSLRRLEGFLQELRANGFEAERCLFDRPMESVPTSIQPLAKPQMQWLKNRVRPIGILAANDIVGFQVVEACRELGLKIPDEVSVVGVDNDDLLYILARPTLTSVAIPTREIGYQAAEILDRILKSPKEEWRNAEPTILKPLGVAARGSTAGFATSNPKIASAIQYIRDHGGRNVGIDRMASDLDVSRRWLERTFQQELGRSPYQEILKWRLRHAQDLLSSTRKSLETVATECGYSSTKRLYEAFQRELSQTPTEYRNRWQGE
jgi:LacI family transcriptional regulator